MKAREVIQKLRDAGWSIKSGGGHQKMAISPDGRTKVPIPDHAGRDIKTGTLKAIERQTGVKMGKK